ncbi:MAG: hypothetical protein E5V81_03860 [Mesorhizobium sp.]|nr:MAG: hypothetical protein E5V81_03860 [Mesorhizobium sp.]
MSPKAMDEGCSRERQRLTPLEHPSSVSALRADPPSPTRGEGGAITSQVIELRRPPPYSSVHDHIRHLRRQPHPRVAHATAHEPARSGHGG